jgi:hypothetical protein
VNHLGKLLLLVVAAIVVFFVLKGFKRTNRGGPGPTGPHDGEQMVHCGHCGVYLPVSESVPEEGRHFCSDEHRRLFRK